MLTDDEIAERRADAEIDARSRARARRALDEIDARQSTAPRCALCGQRTRAPDAWGLCSKTSASHAAQRDDAGRRVFLGDDRPN